MTEFYNGLIIIVSMVVGTLCVKELVKFVFAEIASYKKKMNEPYVKSVNHLLDGCSELVGLMEKLVINELDENNKRYERREKEEKTWDPDDLK